MTTRTATPGYPRGIGTRPPGQPSMRPKATKKPGQPPRLRTAGDDMGPWSQAAACRETDPELFFPVGPGGFSREQVRRAKTVCVRCPVLESCREWALTYPKMAEYGVWGALSEDERRAIQGQAVRASRRAA